MCMQKVIIKFSILDLNVIVMYIDILNCKLFLKTLYTYFFFFFYQVYDPNERLYKCLDERRT